MISIVLPAFDALPYLAETMASVRAQTYPDWELIVVDDGSRDATAAFVEAIEDPRVRLIRLPHSGRPAIVKNAVLREASRPFVAFIDADDLWEPRKLEMQLRALEASGAGWSYTALTRIDAAGRVMRPDGIKPWTPRSGRILVDLLEVDAIVATPTVLARRALIERAGGFDESLQYCQDYDLWFRLAPLGDALALHEPLARVRIHDRSHTVHRLDVHRHWMRAYDKAAAAAPDAAVRTVCRRKRTEHALAAADRAFDAGQSAAGARQWAGAMWRAPLSPPVWRFMARRALGRREPPPAV